MRESWWLLRADAWRFQRARADYYAYLSALLRASDGRLALRDVFANDAARYGTRHWRGRLALRWAKASGTYGGNLAALWAGVAPAQDCLMLATAQAAGSAALAQGLHDLAQACRLAEAARKQLTASLWAAGLALAVLVGTLWAVPLFTVPHLAQVFGDLPAQYHGPQTRALFRFAAHVVWLGPLAALAASGGLGVGVWSMGHWRGRWRKYCDAIGPWRLYRDAQAIRFLSLLEVLIRDGAAMDARLRLALNTLRQYAVPWLAAHITQMLARVESGQVGAATFDTGLLDKELWWFMSDMMAAHGIEAGLSRARLRVEQAWLPRLAAQAVFWRWVLLLAAVVAMLALVFWHYGVIDELRRGLMHFYSAH
ncbi:pilus assembly protein [Bordetella genomosp. 12]|uniref:Pilus assembly protein n=1 Tax=Bordetella genomosp. 12 TaxID=463035 RepID=A0A261VIU8_9BORD|nr:pilus assembly protein [Bordetella genomosp. 12]OZI73999.1 pilus assembly protein [Bordetella genomosp. 12]